MTKDRTILITGVTGHQGGAVAHALQGAGFHLRGLTRKPDSEHAAALKRQGVDVVQGDLDDEASLRRALTGARASVLRRWRARPASNTTSTHPWDRRTSGRESRTSTTSGASRKPCAASASPRM